jgi:hypothetical protein
VNQLEEYAREFQALKSDAETLVAEAGEAELNQAPASGAWTAVQCLAHLNTAGWLLLTRLERQINDARENGPYGEPPFTYGFVSRTFVKMMRPDSSLSIPSPPSYRPDPPYTLTSEAVVEEFLQLQDDLLACVEQSEGLDLRRVRVPSPALPILSISLGAWYEATIAHERRHLAQARRAVETVQAQRSERLDGGNTTH